MKTVIGVVCGAIGMLCMAVGLCVGIYAGCVAKQSTDEDDETGEEMVED